MAQPQPDDSFQAYLAALLALYISAEETLLGGIAGILRFTSPTFLSQVLALSHMRRLAQQVSTQLSAGDRWVQPMLQRAIEAGAKSASTEIVRAGIPPKPPKTPGTDLARNFDFSMPHGDRSVQAIRDDLVSSLTDVRRRITRLPDDVYKVISPAAAAGQALGHGYTPAQAQAYAWREYVRQGITGFTDRSGRNWSLSAYVEMSVRTATTRAYNDSHLQVMQAAHIDLFTVPDDGHPCPLCFPWQNRILSVEPDERAVATIAEATAAGLFHPNCFPGFVSVSAPSGVSAADSRWYEGELVVIHTAAGNELSVTPNHPILTPEGWVRAGNLVIGQDVIRYDIERQRVDGMSPDDQHVEAGIGNVFDALRHSSHVTTVSVPSTAEQFHGDGGDADVEVVLVDRLLEYGDNPTVGESLANHALFVGGVRFASLLPNGASDEVLMSASHTPDGGVGRTDEFGPLCGRHARMTFDGTGGLGDRDTTAFEPRTDRRLMSVEDGRDLALSLTSEVSNDRIVKVSIREFAGHVYNLQTRDGWYTANSIVVHNCKHILAPVIPGVTVLPAPREWTEQDALNYRNTQKQRRLELEIRKAKRRLEYAIDPATQAAARGDVRSAQARMRQFVAETGFLRQSRREQLDLANDHLKLPAIR